MEKRKISSHCENILTSIKGDHFAPYDHIETPSCTFILQQQIPAGVDDTAVRHTPCECMIRVAALQLTNCSGAAYVLKLLSRCFAMNLAGATSSHGRKVRQFIGKR